MHDSITNILFFLFILTIFGAAYSIFGGFMIVTSITTIIIIIHVAAHGNRKVFHLRCGIPGANIFGWAFMPVKPEG